MRTDLSPSPRRYEMMNYMTYRAVRPQEKVTGATYCTDDDHGRCPAPAAPVSAV